MTRDDPHPIPTLTQPVTPHHLPSSLSSPRRETDRVAFPSVTPPYGVYVMRETRKGTYEWWILL